MKAVIPSEHEEQKAFFMWLAYTGNRFPECNRFFAVPNGGERHRAVAAKLKAEGVKPGIPDTFLPVPRKGYHGLWLEMKRIKGSQTSSDQKEWIQYLNDAGYMALIVKGWRKAAQATVDYLDLPVKVRG